MSTVYGQKGVDAGSKWGAGTRETEVKLGGWCESGLEQQGNDGRGCASMRERPERVESSDTHETNAFHTAIFAWPCSFGPPSRAMVVITWRGVGCRYMMRLG